MRISTSEGSTSDRPGLDLTEHQGIYEAVRDQDGALAAERMRVHILELAERYRRVGAG